MRRIGSLPSLDEENFGSWESLCIPIRVVNQSRQEELRTAEQASMSSKRRYGIGLPPYKEAVPTKSFVPIAHKRWRIENNGFKNSFTPGMRITSISMTLMPSCILADHHARVYDRPCFCGATS